MFFCETGPRIRSFYYQVGARPEGWKTGGKTVKEKEGVAMLLQKIGMSPKQIDCVDVMLQAVFPLNS